ncbi:hypothetical protein BH20ACI4_BH20ACI4_25550 [soil metagenome]
MTKFTILLFFSLFFVCSYAVSAQSTVINTSSTDTLEEGFFYIEADFAAHFDKYRNGGFQSYGSRMVYGFKRKFEAGANFFYTRDGSRPAPKEFQANAKWQPYQNERRKIAFSTGVQLFVPLDKSAGRRPFAVVNGNGSKVFNPTNGTRVTAGFYQTIGAEKDFGTKRGATLAVEQPISRRFSFAADWSSGNNRFGYTAAGLNFNPTPRHLVFAGYNFGNSGRGNNSFITYYGYTF